MVRIVKKITAAALAVLILGSVNHYSVLAEPFVNDEGAPEVLARAALLYDVDNGKVLFAKNERARMYPASMTKLLTALVFLDWFSIYESVKCGPEVNAAPADSSLSGNFEGETMTVENALRGLIIPSGNETACVVAAVTAKRATGDYSMGYAAAERWFSDAMNKRAKALGALDTNFVNPHGFHDARHYTTAYDMALIAAEALKNPDIARVALEVAFNGNGGGDNPSEDALTKNYTWQTHNELIMPSSPYYYPYATGLKTGTHDDAGDCLAASAVKGGRTLVAIAMFSPVPGRWLDCVSMFEYGFNNFSVRTIQGGDVDLGEMPVSNPRLGDASSVEYMTAGGTEMLMSNAQFARIERTITFFPELIADPVVDEATGKKDMTIRLKTPIEEGQVIGYVDYMLDGESIFHADITSKDEALERTFNTDVDYYVAIWKKRAVSPYAVPVYTGAVILVFLIFKGIASARRRSRNGSYGYGRRYR